MSDVNDEKKSEKHEESGTRRGLFLGLSGLAIAALASKSKNAVADVVGGDTAILSEMLVWMKTTWTTSILPTIKMLNDAYKTAKDWINTWNDFVTAWNQGAAFVEDALTAITDPQQNIFYLQMKQMIDYVDHILDYKGNILNFRLQYLNPVLFQKIDSLIFQAQSFTSRAQNLAMLKYFGKSNEADLSGISEERKKDFIRQYPKSNTSKFAIRASNDIANYGYDSLRIESLKGTVDYIKKMVGSYPVSPGKPKKGEAPQKSRGQVFQELAAVTNTDISLQMLHLLNEISLKLTNMTVILSQTGQPPIVADNEQIVSTDMFAALTKKMQESVSGTEYDLLKKTQPS